ncbi:isochorismate synthase [Tenacibaculum finnmarkense]|uniref:isochorismate synthase n=1 Tax=Tenacibaculum finnmarkense TaxID=2781243 RepID=UPI001E370FFA|nr:isochorismate synthase [Tenacibaculum finnmarkense]MCD8400557.1 isochorismate synthase [Tenacibaculum finnmarkense genomovar ulcerans]MCG8796126.1 isochorismate synthase [Tenacibaculum finnmarkense]MCG8798481.1 isochorismate synthase [Tenacibaculum finnmarkense]MCG8812340.1 isochorismate synthase [Tenacibaculum finnmarkense]
MNIFSKIEKALENKLPFVVYRKPNSTLLNGFFQNNDTLYTATNYTESGFVFAAFDDKNKAILIPRNKAEFLQENSLNPIITDADSESKPKNHQKNKQDDRQEKAHIKLVQKGIDAINSGLFKKVILSRKELIKLTDFNVISVFKKLLANYNTAFTYVWYHPKVGMWLGATPETLVEIKGQQFKTMSLAGTQVFKGTTNVIWQPKELEEQQFVTDYITDKLSEICNSLEKGEVKTAKAGNLLHLKTLISGKMTTKNAVLIKKLHPTPAVCGVPLEASKAFILKNENYNRAYYTGFLGELNLNETSKNTSELFVNLRCMEIKKDIAVLFIGGGITKESNPESEWLETVSKSETMKKVL